MFFPTGYNISGCAQRLIFNIVKRSEKIESGIYAQNQHLYQNKSVMTQGLPPTQFKLIFLSNYI